MKMLISSFFLLFIAFSTSAQATEMAIAKVEYTFSHIRDTTEPDKPYQENMVLIIGKNASRYLSLDAITERVRMDKMMQKQMSEQQGGNLKIDMGRMKPVSRDEYFYFTKENKLLVQQRLMNTYLIEEPDNNIDWKITNDTMSFEGIHCQKATAHYKGRNWIAWYATELPFQSGPWKLNGLPGLIIDAYDDKNEVKFQFAGMQMIKD
ncbi:MAG: GLPGLI family protein, partial [Ginsengibacter sp.]